jgi:AraC-like DNA-binding protein
MRDLTFLHCGQNLRCDARVDKWFDYYTLQLMTRGEIEVLYDERKYALRGGWFWPAFPGPHVRFHLAPNCASWEHRYVAFTGAQVNEWKAAKLWVETPQPLPSKRLVKLFDELLVQALRTDVWGVRRAANLLEQVLIEMAEARTQLPTHEPWLESALEVLNEQSVFAPDYEKLARVCGMGQSTLRRRFKEATGTTLHSYVMQRRMAHAKQLLGETDWPLKQIASRLQFSDVYFFSSQFKKMAGVSPTAYRKTRQR